MPRLPLYAVLAAVAFAVLAALVGAGELTSIDQYAVSHLMPGLAPPHRESPFIYDVIPFATASSETTIQILVDAFTLPASAGVSGLLFAGGAWLLRRRGELRIGLLWLATWVVVNAVEVLVKAAVARPGLSAKAGGRRVHGLGFDHAFPSGHAARALLVAALCAFLWPRLWRPAVAWGALTLPALVAAGFHTPTDVVGGVLLAAVAVPLVATAVRTPRLPFRAPS